MLGIGRYSALALGVLCLTTLHCKGGGNGVDSETNCWDLLDDDGDGQVDCADSDCATDPYCTSSCNFNSVCEAGENTSNCPFDCSSSVCGNGVCELGETALTCAADCAANTCGNGTCDAGETATNCPADCSANTCGNGTCDAGETAINCPADCGGGGDCDFNTFTAVAEVATSTANKMFYQGMSAASLPADVVYVEIWPSFGGPSTPGTYDLQLNGNHNYETCGLCPLLMANTNASTGPEKLFYADTGTVEITSIGGIGSVFAATMHNVIFREVTIDESTAISTPVPGGETWCFDGYSFSQSVQEGSACTNPGTCVGDTISDFSLTSCDTGQPVTMASVASGKNALWFVATHDW